MQISPSPSFSKTGNVIEDEKIEKYLRKMPGRGGKL
jgi:hypothetical protein